MKDFEQKELELKDFEQKELELNEKELSIGFWRDTICVVILLMGGVFCFHLIIGNDKPVVNFGCLQTCSKYHRSILSNQHFVGKAVGMLVPVVEQ